MVGGMAASRTVHTATVSLIGCATVVLTGCSSGGSAPDQATAIATKGDTTVRETSVYACGTANQDAAKALPEFIKPASSLFDIDALAR